VGCACNTDYNQFFFLVEGITQGCSGALPRDLVDLGSDAGGVLVFCSVLVGGT